MKIRLAKDFEQERWDAFVLSHPNASPYHLFAWKKAIEEAYKHKCIYLYAEKNKEILGVLPIVHLHLYGIINEMISLPFCDVGGCIAESKEVQDRLCSEGIQYIEKSKVKRSQIRGQLFKTDIVQSKFEMRGTKKVRMFLELQKSSDDLFKSFKSKLRSQVRKAAKNGVIFIWGSEGDIDSAYSVFSKNMHELGSPVHSKSFLSAVLSHYGSRAKLGLVQFQGKTIGMGIILFGGKGVSIPWASTGREYNRLGPNMLLYWNFLKYSADNGYDFFDFGRSTEGEGTYNFKKQWGAKPVPLVWFDTIDMIKKKSTSLQIDDEKEKRERIAALWQKLPLRIANIFGPYIRKYISL
jgi:FemAB-related protein (PEP-CTERM system-associated)